MSETIRLGIVGLGRNTRNRHVPGFQGIPGVQIVGVCNRTIESTRSAAVEFAIPKTYSQWEELVDDQDIDAVMIGTWPYLHAPITVAALQSGKHVLTEARMASSLAEAYKMLEVSKQYPHLVTQIVPSPFGLRAGKFLKKMLDEGFLGDLREFTVRGLNADFAHAGTSLHWRQSREFSGINILSLGILHETLTRWIADPVRVFASTRSFTPEATRPESVQVLSELKDGARGVYQLSGVCFHGGESRIELYGSRGTIHYLLQSERLLAGQADEKQLNEIEVPEEYQAVWHVEEDFIEALRGGPRPRLTDFETGVRYMQFTDAVERSAREHQPVTVHKLEH